LVSALAAMKKRIVMTRVKIQTMLGDIVVRLYDETPIHRDNFVKLVKEGYYDGTLFHRVIKDFMIQGSATGRGDRPIDDIEMRMTVI
jgi:cyclophilin family peptidyl-prolyl cis-trans isomerase